MHFVPSPLSDEIWIKESVNTIDDEIIEDYLDDVHNYFTVSLQ